MSSLMKYTDDARSTLVSGITAIATTLHVNSADSFPAITGDEWFPATLYRLSDGQKETVKVTAISGTTFTIDRDFYDDTSLVFVANDRISIRMNQAILDEYPQFRSVESVSDLRSLTPLGGAVCYAEYHTSATAGGGGRFRAYAGEVAGTYTDNNWRVIVPTGGDGSAAWVREHSAVVTSAMCGALYDGSTDDSAAEQLAHDAVKDGYAMYWVADEGNHLIGSGLTFDGDRVTLHAWGATFTADTGVTALITAGSDGRTDHQKIYGLKIDGGSTCSYGIKDIGTRFFHMEGVQGFNLIEGLFYQAPTSSGGYSEFATLDYCYTEDGKWLHKAVATATSRVTDTKLNECVAFRPTEWFAHWVDCERMIAEDCMAGSQQNTFNGGVCIEADGLGGVATPANGTTNCRVRNFYLESNSTYGSGMSVVVMKNPNAGEKVQGNIVENSKCVPVNVVQIARLETPATPGNTRQNTIINMDPLGGFADSIEVQSNVSYTHIVLNNHEGDPETQINDSGIKTTINDTYADTTISNGIAPTEGTYGQVVRNYSDNSLWMMADDGNRYRISAGELYGKGTFGLSVALGTDLAPLTGHEWDFTVTGAAMGDAVDVSIGIDCGTIIIVAAVTAIDTVTVRWFNTSTTTAQPLANTTYRFTVRRLIA